MLNKDFQILTGYIQCFNSLKNFNTDLIEEWTTALLNSGYESEAGFMLASFSKPIEFYEVEPYLKKILRELGLKKKDESEAEESFIRYHINQIANSRNIRESLSTVADWYYSSDLELSDFYFLNLGWEDLDVFGCSYYYQNVDLSTIEQVVIGKAALWLKKEEGR
nr:hypothetical protein [uncultured Flavobacterium sp.]